MPHFSDDSMPESAAHVYPAGNSQPKVRMKIAADRAGRRGDQYSLNTTRQQEGGDHRKIIPAMR